MVLHRRLDYGFNGYKVPAFPRSSRSARGRSYFKRKVEDNQMYAFELLAAVAGKLLQEGENSHYPSSAEDVRVQSSNGEYTGKQERRDEENHLKVEPWDPGSCDESVFISDPSVQGHIQNITSMDSPHVKHDVGLEHSSIIASSDCSDKFGCTEVVIGRNRTEFVEFLRKTDEESPGCGESCGNLVNRTEGQLESEGEKISSVINSTVPDSCSSEYPMELDSAPSTLVSSYGSVEVPMCKDHTLHNSFLSFRTDVKVVSKDDDENSSGCTHPSTGNMKAFRPSPRIGDRRIRKLLASKYWKVAPKLNDGVLSNNDIRSVFRNRKACYTRQRSQRNSVFKRRRLFEHRSISTCEEKNSSEGISKLPKKDKNADATGSANQASSSVAGQESSFRSKDSHVKLSIKSFRVPEFFIDIPETATVGYLKRKVREAVATILGGGLCVGVVLQGKKVRDDHKTLLQTGISCDEKLDALGFTLEPNPALAPAPQPLFHEEPPFLAPCDISEPIARYPNTHTGDPAPSDASPCLTLINEHTFAENNFDAVPSPTDVSADKATLESRALVAIPTSVEALAVVPLLKKSRQSELVQRRIRRPFSVSEVEALVQAVEKLGTGRWRDVKLRAFHNAKHRTYVDLKDKWKTLVHTARISPQQRRGEPVPQELLDRVLAAHAHWSQQQVKQQIKQQQTETCLLL